MWILKNKMIQINLQNGKGLTENKLMTANGRDSRKE